MYFSIFLISTNKKQSEIILNTSQNQRFFLFLIKIKKNTLFIKISVLYRGHSFIKIVLKVGSKAPLFCLTKEEYMQKKHHLQDMLEPVINKLGFDLVRILTIGNINPTLQIMIERKDRKNIVVDDCATVSRAVSAVLDEKDPISGKYTLEVSSPGLDRPLVNLENFVRFAGFEAKVETDTEIEKRKRFKGRIVRVDNNNIILLMDDKEWSIPFDAVAKAKLLLTDELIAAAQAEADEQEEI